MTREETLDTAKKMVCGHREQDYGKPENNFQAIADLWNAYWTNVRFAENSNGIGRVTNRPFSAFDVAMLMALLKVGRIATGTATDDSFVDVCGYLACGAEIKSIETKQSLNEMIDLNQEAVDTFKELNEKLKRIKSEGSNSNKKSNGLKDLILKAYSNVNGYITCYACPLSNKNASKCPYDGKCEGLDDAVDYIYNYLEDKAHEDPIMALLKTMLEDDKDGN